MKLIKIIKINNFINFYIFFCFLNFILLMLGYLNFKYNNSNLFELAQLSQNPYKPVLSYVISFPIKTIILSLFFFLYIKKEYIQEIIKATIIILIAVCSYTLTLIYIDFIFFEHNIFYYSNTINFGQTFNNPNPRITSISRMLCALLILFSFFFLNFKKKTYLFCGLLFIFFILLNIYLLQSRPSLYFSIIVIFYIFFKKFNLIKSLFITILIYFLIIKASLGLIYLKNNLNINIVKIEDKFIEHVNENSNLKSLNLNLRSNNKISSDMNINEKINTLTTGRFELWRKIITYNQTSNKNFYFGFGPMSDRFLIKENSSSGFMYMLISSGILGLTSYVLLLILISIKILNLIIIYKLKNNILNTSKLLMIFIILRSIVENSFIIIGLDLYLFLISYFIIINHKQIAQSKY